MPPKAKESTVPRRSYKKSLTFSSFNRLTSISSSVSNRIRRSRSSFGPLAQNGVDLKDQNKDEMPMAQLDGQDPPSDKSTDASSSYNSLDADAALLSSTLVKVHQNMEGWQTGNWEEETCSDRGLVVTEKRPKARFSFCNMTCCGKIDDASFDEPQKVGFLPYKISRRRSSLRVPKLEIECTLKDEGGDDREYELIICPKSQPLICNRYRSNNIQPQIPLPLEWTHSPLLLTATPGSGTIIRRIRRVCDVDLGDMHSECLELHAQLPINNGRESQPLVIDFEAPSFEGTALFRIRNSAGTSSEPEGANLPSQQRSKGKKGDPDYFAGYNRKFQMIIRGKFRRPDVIMADCMSGMILDRPLRTAGSPITDPLLACAEINPPESNSVATKKSRRKKKPNKDEGLPPKWVLRASVKIAGLFSPRMDADLECAHPRILSPLCSMAQSIHVGKEKECPPLDVPHTEPSHQSTESLVHELRNCHADISGNTSVQIRKKTFDSVCDARVSQLQAHSPCFDTNATYTFEFLQHLIDYNDFSLDFGSIVGKMKLGGALKGQPCRFVAGVVSRDGMERELTLRDMDCLWSFDLWHESLYVTRNGALSPSM